MLGQDTQAPRVATPRFQILALSGGGFRGLYTAKVLAKLEQRAKKPLADIFDLIAGTSVGSIIASGLALKIPADEIAHSFETHGKCIFKPPFLGFVRQWISAKYAQDPLRNSIIKILGAENVSVSLNEIDAPLLITAVSQTLAETVPMASRGFASIKASNQLLLDAILSSSAAPGYFPPHTVGNEVFVDGGLVANAPELVAVTQALSMTAADIKNLHVLSIGTVGNRKNDQHRHPGSPGIVKWMMSRGLFQLTLSAQERMAVEQCSSLLDDRYCRLDQVPTDEQSRFLGLDIANDSACKILTSLAEDTVNSALQNDRFRIDGFLSHNTTRSVETLRTSTKTASS